MVVLVNNQEIECIENADYLTLESPQFVGQTRLREDNSYLMVFSQGTEHYVFKQYL